MFGSESEVSTILGVNGAAGAATEAAPFRLPGEMKASMDYAAPALQRGDP